MRLLESRGSCFSVSGILDKLFVLLVVEALLSGTIAVKLVLCVSHGELEAIACVFVLTG